MAACVTSNFRAVRLTAPLVALVVMACVSSAGAGDVPPRFVFLLDEPQIEPATDTLKVLIPGEEAGTDATTSGEAATDESGARHRDNAKIIGGTFFGSGILLCGWGITSWQFEEDQCCPTRNTENVLKIIVGVVFVNAGLAYLLGVLD